jgi:hypothetical protein
LGILGDFRFASYKVSAAKKVIFFCRFRAQHACFYIGLDQRLRTLSRIVEAAAARDIVRVRSGHF